MTLVQLLQSGLLVEGVRFRHAAGNQTIVRLLSTIIGVQCGPGPNTRYNLADVDDLERVTSAFAWVAVDEDVPVCVELRADNMFCVVHDQTG